MKHRLALGYRASYRKWSVKILFPLNGDWDENAEHGVQDMIDWCENTGLGRRMAYDEFMFDTEASATVFILKFS